MQEDADNKKIGADMFHSGDPFPEKEKEAVQRGWKLARAKENERVRTAQRMREHAEVLKEEVKLNELKARNAKAKKKISDNKTTDDWF